MFGIVVIHFNIQKQKIHQSLLEEKKIKPLIQADLWDGYPDIDAICRLATRCNLNLSYPHGDFYASSDMSPFNSQNTFIHRDALPEYMFFRMLGGWMTSGVATYYK